MTAQQAEQPRTDTPFRQKLYHAAVRAALVPNDFDSLVREFEEVAAAYENLEAYERDLHGRIRGLLDLLGDERVCGCGATMWVVNEFVTDCASYYNEDGSEHECPGEPWTGDVETGGSG